MKGDFLRRLESATARVEAEKQAAGPRGLDQLTKLKLLVLAVYEGHVQPNESLMCGLQRALRFANMAAINAALQAPGHHGFHERYEAAWERLFSSRGLDPDKMTGAQIAEVMGVLIEGIPPEHFWRVGLDPRGPTDG